MTSFYILQASWMSGKLVCSSYLTIPELELTPVKNKATVLTSKSLAIGWLLKAQSTYKTYKIHMINL